MLRFLNPEGFAIKNRAVCDVCAVKDLAAKDGFKPTLNVKYPFQPGQLIGALRVSGKTEFTDFRGQPVKAGVYTLRYGQQPQDGNHIGTSELSDFLLAIPATTDTDLKPTRPSKNCTKPAQIDRGKSSGHLFAPAGRYGRHLGQPGQGRQQPLGAGRPRARHAGGQESLVVVATDRDWEGRRMRRPCGQRPVVGTVRCFWNCVPIMGRFQACDGGRPGVEDVTQGEADPSSQELFRGKIVFLRKRWRVPKSNPAKNSTNRSSSKRRPASLIPIVPDCAAGHFFRTSGCATGRLS